MKLLPIFVRYFLFVATFSVFVNAADSIDRAILVTSEITLPLENGDKVTAKRISGADLGAGNFSWTGELEGEQAGFVTFTKVSDWLSGTVHFLEGITYSFRGPMDRVELKRLNAKARSCGGCLTTTKGQPLDPRRQRRIKTWRNGDGNLVDLLIVYPSAVATAAGGVSGLEADVFNSVAGANLCYRNSKVKLQLRLVHLAKVSYSTTGNLETDLERLENPTDDYMDNVHDLRDQYGADLVALLATDSSSGGLANTMMFPSLDFASQGFSVSVWDQIGAPSYTLAHELGHNMGCLHNREDSGDVDDGYEYRAFSYGKRWLPGSPGYATVMSYDTEPTSTYPNTIPYFSNPNVSYLGTPTGNEGTEDNAQVLSFTTPYVANFRRSVVPGIVPSFSSIAVNEGEAAVVNVRLATEPTSPITVTASIADDGDVDLLLSGSTSFTFDSGNWNLPHPVHIYARNDADGTNGTAVLSLSSAGMTTSTVTITESDSGSSVAADYLVSGTIANSLGIGISSVTLTFSNFGGTVTTDSNGGFHHLLESGWAGTLTPSKNSHTFAPSSGSISSLSGNSIGISFSASRSNILYVDVSASGSGDGSSWAHAFTDLDAALRSEHPFSEVWVAKGTYKPGVVRSSAFLLPSGIAVYGGFVGTEIARDERNPTANLTVLSGDLGTNGDTADNAYHIVIPATGSTLDGFIIQNGNASENFGDDRGRGGALWAEKVTFGLSNCIFTSNFANERGGAIFLNDANATFTSCTFFGNTNGSTGSGGALDANNSILNLVSCSFSNNVSQFEGGAINSQNSTLIFSNSSFTSNQNASANGGGALNVSGGTLSDVNGTYSNNSCAPGSGGGAIQWAGNSANFSGTSFQSNQASTYNGGAILASSGELIFSNCSFGSNLAGGAGGAVMGTGVSLSISDSNFSSNQSSLNGGGVAAENSTVVMARTVFSSNQSTSNNGGGACHTKGGSWTDSNCTYIFNKATSSGGAFLWENSIGSITDANFTDNENTVWNGGGGIYLKNASPAISRCSFVGNVTTANNFGGGIRLSNASPTISNCLFSRNSAAINSGGAISIDQSSIPILAGNEFRYNSAHSYGGALYLSNSQNIQASNNLFLGNYADSGGAISAWGTTGITFRNCRFLGNEANASSASSGGMALLANDATGTTFVNCVIAGNKANYRSGVLTLSGSTRFVNCSISGNSADTAGIVLLFDGEVLEIENSILWGNSANDVPDVYTNTGTVSINNSLFSASQSSGLPNGNGNLSNDPLFTDVDGIDNLLGTFDDDLTLQSSSPAINQASSSVSGYSTTDLLGKTRSGTPDLGAYEFIPNSAPSITQGTNATLSLNEDGAISTSYSVTDVDGDSLSWSILTEADHGEVTVEANSGVLTYSSKEDYFGEDSFTLQVSDGMNIAQIEVTVTVNPINDSPFLTNSIDAGTLAVTVKDGNATVVTLTASDKEGDDVSYSLGDTHDEAFFELNSATGQLRFNNPPEHKNPLDSNADNLYLLTVFYTDGNAPPNNIEIRVTVISSGSSSIVTYVNLKTQIQGLGTVTTTGGENYEQGDTTSLTATPFSRHTFSHWTGDINGSTNPHVLTMDANKTVIAVFSKVNAIPQLTHPLVDNNFSITLNENATVAIDLNATDDDNDTVIFSLSGKDAELFDLNSSTGILTFLSPPDYENPDDFGQNHTYDLTISLSDGIDVSSANLLISILNDIEEPPVNFTLTIGIEGFGTVAASDGQSASSTVDFLYSVDSNVTLTAAATIGHTFTGWQFDATGVANPTVVRMTADKSVTAVFTSNDSWTLAEDKGSMWRYFSWLGHYYDTTVGWIFHEDHGWLYLVSDSTSSVWIYEPLLGWLWTNSAIYPYVYRHSTKGWLYYQRDSQDPRIFYDYSLSRWLSVSLGETAVNQNASSYDWNSTTTLSPGYGWNLTDLAVSFRWKRELRYNDQSEQYFGPENYRLQVDDDLAFVSPEINILQTPPKASYESDASTFANWTQIAYMPPVLLPKGTYHWRVKIEDGNGSPWSAPVTFIVNDDHSSGTLVRPLGPDAPLFSFDMFCGTGTEGLLDRVPEIHASFPESVRPYVAFAIDCEIIGTNPTLDDGFDGTFTDMIRPMAEAGVPLLVKTGGPDKDFQQFADLAELEQLFKTYPNLIGSVQGETFWDFIDSDFNSTIREQQFTWYKRSFLLAAKYGRLVILGNGNDEDFVWDKFLGQENNSTPWMTPEEFEALAPNLVMAPKNNIPFGYYQAEAAVMGSWLSGQTDHWGIWSEGWGWGSIGYDKLFGEQNKGNADDPDFSSMPYNVWIQMKLAGLSQGATVFHFGGESSVVEWGEYDSINDQFVSDDSNLTQSTAFWDMAGNEHPALKRYIVPFLKSVITEKLIPSKVEVLDKVKFAVSAPAPEIAKGSALDYGNYASLLQATVGIPDYLSIQNAQAANPDVEYYELIPNANRRELLHDVGRYYIAPILPYPVTSLSDDTKVLSLDDLGTIEAVRAQVDPLYPEVTSGTAWVVRVGNRIFVSNGLENTDRAQSFSIPVDAFGTLSGTIQPHSYLLATIGNERLWLMANADTKGAYNDDRTTHLQIEGLTAEPSWSVIAGSVDASWTNGILNLQLQHQEGATEAIVSP